MPRLPAQVALSSLSALLLLSLAACNGKGDDCGSTVYADADGDGFGDPASSANACDVDGGHVDDGTDCDDGDDARFPGAPEVCADGVVNDCGGGVGDAQWACADGADLTASRFTFTGEGGAGGAVASAGDTNGDGAPEILVGAPGFNAQAGRVYLLDFAPGSGDPADAIAVFDGDLVFEVSSAVPTGALAFYAWVPGEPEPAATAWHTAAATGTTVGIAMPEVGGDDLLALGGEGSTFLGALFQPAFFLDDDGDLAHGDGEVFVGVPPYWVAWLQGVPTEFLELGFQEGWNGVQFAPDSEDADWLDPQALVLDANLAAVESVTLGGTYGGSEDIAGLGLLALSYVALDGPPPEAWLYDAALSDPWSITFSGDPPADHLVASDDSDALWSAQFPVAYGDTDGSGTLNGSEGGLYLACLGDGVATAVWSSPPTELLPALYMAGTGGRAGWSAVVQQPDGAGPLPLTESESAALVIGEGCSL